MDVVRGCMLQRLGGELGGEDAESAIDQLYVIVLHVAHGRASIKRHRAAVHLQTAACWDSDRAHPVVIHPSAPLLPWAS